MRQIWKILTVVLLIIFVSLGLFAIISQFRPNPAQDYTVTHHTNNNITYYEWDDLGNITELKAVYQEYGYLNGFVDSDFFNNPAIYANEESPLHRVGYSFVLEEWVDKPLLSIIGRNIPFIIFLDDEILYTDFPGETVSRTQLPNGDKGIYKLYNAEPTRSLEISLPGDYVGKTLTIVEYITPQQVEFWFPLTVGIINIETPLLIYLFSYGPSIFGSGLVAAILITLTALFIWRLANGQQSWLLLLPIVFVFLTMIDMANFMNTSPSVLILNVLEFVDAVLRYCAGDLLLIFIAFKMKRKIRFALMGISAMHFIIVIAFLIYKLSMGEFLHLYGYFLGFLGFFCYVFAIVLMCLESKNNNNNHIDACIVRV